MITKYLRFLRDESSTILVFADIDNEFEFRIDSKDVDVSEISLLEFGREYIAKCDDQDFWRFEKVDHN